MIPFVLGAVALGATGYGVKKYIESDIDRSIAFDDMVSSFAEKTVDALNEFELKYLMPDWYYENDDIEDVKVTHNLQSFYELKQSVYNSSYQEFQTILKEIKNLNLDTQKEINLKNNSAKTQEHIQEITDTSNELYILLYGSNVLFQRYISKMTDILAVSKDYNSYSNDARKTLSNALVLSNTINDILNIKVVSKKDKPTKSSKELVEEVKKVLVSFKESPREKLVA